MPQSYYIDHSIPLERDRKNCLRALLQTLQKNNISLMFYEGKLSPLFIMNNLEIFEGTPDKDIIDKLHKLRDFTVYLSDDEWIDLRNEGTTSSLDIHISWDALEIHSPKEKYIAKGWFEDDKTVNPYHLLMFNIIDRRMAYIKPKSETCMINYMIRLEQLAMDLHLSLGCQKTIGAHELAQNDEGCFEILERRNGDFAFLPSIWFAIVDPANYGGEKFFLEELEADFKVWKEINPWHKGPHLLDFKRLENGHIFYRVSEVGYWSPDTE